MREVLNEKFGYLTVIEFSHKDKNQKMWKCLCICGKIHTARQNNLVYGSTKSCGCKRFEREDYKDRFFRNFDKTDSCWVWNSYLDSGGYAFFCHKKKERAHRISWEIHHGEIPKDTYVLHKCDNRKDMINKGRQAKGEMFGSTPLKNEDVIEIRRLRNEGFTLQKLSDVYGVTTENIRRIEKRITWRHI